MLPRRVLAACTSAALLTGLGVITAPAAPAASPADGPIACPDALPTADAVEGVRGIGWTVERGTKPARFDAMVLGRMEDAFPGGGDLILAELSSPALTRAGGVWAGMSGSPVYTEDGRLIGAVAYTLGLNTTIAGLTPAEDMKTLLGPAPSTSTQSAKQLAQTQSVEIDRQMAATLAQTGEVSASEATRSGLRRLDVPVMVQGAARDVGTAVQRLSRKYQGLRFMAGGATGTTSTEDPGQITAGGNFAVALSYGSVSLAGVGTTTMVCNGQAVAFGHPMMAYGKVAYSAHTASAVAVQPDLLGAFKVANVGGIVGTVGSDRTYGIAGKLGAGPQVIPFTTSITTGSGATLAATTYTSEPYWMDASTGEHVLGAVSKALGADASGGSAALTLKIEGLRENGTKFTMTRSDRFSAARDLPLTIAENIVATLWPAVDQSLENARLTKVTLSGTVSEKINSYHVVGLNVLSNGSYVKAPKVVKAKAGSTVRLQVLMAGYRSTVTKKVALAVPLPAAAKAGWEGFLTVSAGASFSEEEFGGDAPGDYLQLLKDLKNAPTNDSLSGNILVSNLETGAERTSKASRRLSGAAEPYTKDLEIRVT